MNESLWNQFHSERKGLPRVIPRWIPRQHVLKRYVRNQLYYRSTYVLVRLSKLYRVTLSINSFHKDDWPSYKLSGKKCDMAQNNRCWNRGQNQNKTKKRWLMHWKSYQSKRSIHMFVCIVNTDITQYMNHSHQIVKYIQLKLDVQKFLWSLWLAVISLLYIRSTIHYPPIKFKIHTYYNFSHVILLRK